MPELEIKTLKDAQRIRNLDLNIKLEIGEETTYYRVDKQNEEDFLDAVSWVKRGVYPTSAGAKNICEEYGTPTSRDEFEKADTFWIKKFGNGPLSCDPYTCDIFRAEF